MALSTGLEEVPNQPELINNVGMCALLEGDYATADEYFQQAVELRPGDHRYLANLAVSRGMLGEHDASLALFKRYLQPSDAYHNLAVLHEARGETEAAATAFRESRKRTAARPQQP